MSVSLLSSLGTLARTLARRAGVPVLRTCLAANEAETIAARRVQILAQEAPERKDSTTQNDGKDYRFL